MSTKQADRSNQRSMQSSPFQASLTIPSYKSTESHEFEIQSDDDDDEMELDSGSTAEGVLGKRKREPGVLGATSDPDSNHQQLLVEHFERRIGAIPHTTTELITILKATGGDLDKSEATFWFAQAQRRNRRSWNNPTAVKQAKSRTPHSQLKDLKPSSSDIFGPRYIGGYTIEEHMEKLGDTKLELPTNYRGNELPYTGNIDYERRETVQVFADIVLEQYGVLLCRSEAALVMAAASWNIERAVSRYKDSEAILRTRAFLATFFDARNLQNQRDEQLALFITYTGHPSYFSCQIHLEKHDWNFIKAISAWVETGIAPLRDKQDKPGKQMDGKGRRRDFNDQHIPLPLARDTNRRIKADKDAIWAPEPRFFMSPEDAKEHDILAIIMESPSCIDHPWLANLAKSNGKVGKPAKIRKGAIINFNSENPMRGLPDWTAFRFEYIKNGKYFNVPYRNGYGLAERGENRVTTDDNIGNPAKQKGCLFNWNDKAHVFRLAKWKVQKLTRVIGLQKRKARQCLSPLEKQFLYDFCFDEFRKHRLANPGMSDNALRRSFRISQASKTLLEQQWNSRFAKTQPPRTAAYLMQLIKRWPKLAREFGMTVDLKGPRTDKDEDFYPWEEGYTGDKSEDEDEDDGSSITVEEGEEYSEDERPAEKRRRN